MTDFTTDTKLRLEALRLANQTARDLEADPVELATRYYAFLAGTGIVNKSDEFPDSYFDVRMRLPVDHASAAPEQARLEFSSRSGQDKVDVYAQIVTLVHESGVFVDPVLLTSKIGRIITAAKVRGE